MASEPPLDLMRTKRERTRAALIEAASAIIVEQGFAAASLDAIARRAGMTKGAIYSNFADKSELLIAVRGARAPMLQPPFEPGAPLRRQMQLIAETLIETLPRIQAESRFVAQYQLHAQEDEEFRRVLDLQYSAVFDSAGSIFDAGVDDLLIKGRDLMVIIQSVTLGFVQQSFLTPRDVTPEIIRDAFNAIANGVVRPPGGAKTVRSKR